MKRAVWLLLLVGFGCAVACGKKDAESKSGPAAQGDRPADQPTAFEKYATHLDLWEHAHLAEVDHQGLYIEFGGPTRAKYTYGEWRSGFGKDGAAGADTFSYANADSCRVYFSVDKREPLTLRLRMKPVETPGASKPWATALFTPYLNGEALPAVRFDSNDFKDYDVAVPAERVEAGENRLMLRFGGTAVVHGEPLAAAIASIRVAKGTLAQAPAEYSAPHFAELRTEIAVGGVQRRALAVRAPTTLSWYFEVPKGGKLGFGVGVSGDKPKGAKARIRVTPEGGEPKVVFSADLKPAWRDEVVSLEPYAGKVVRIDMVAEGEVGRGRVAWSTPALLVPPKAVGKPAKTAKNVVLVLIDTMRARSLKPFNPNSRVKTPVLDKIAQEGALFEAAQAPENWTKPSTTSVLTGLYPATHGAKTDGAMVPKSATLLSEALKEAGFATGSFIANGYVSDKFGFKQGWDFYTNYIREKKTTDAENVFKEAGDWVEQHKDERFFAYVHTIDPHVPYDPPEQFLSMYTKAPYSGVVSPRKTPDQLAEAKHTPPKINFNAADKQYLRDLYDGEVSYHDYYLGLFVERLKKLGVYEDTVFVVTADHGEEFDEHGSFGHGHSVYQELLWVPFMVRFPGVVPPGTRISQTASTLGVFPTVLEAVGLPAASQVEEKSYLSWIRGAAAPATPVAFSDFLDDRRVIRAGRWKLILRGTNETFFDLETDPTEQKELDRSKFPIASRYTTILLGQFLGAKDRRSWLRGGGTGQKLEQEDANIDDVTRAQLKAIGYAGDGPHGPQPADTH
jgi:arylsulfatase A-like enzyme